MRGESMTGWLKSTFSGTGNCVEVALVGASVLVRDTKNRSGGTLTFTRDEWQAFVEGVMHGEFDPPEPEQTDR